MHKLNPAPRRRPAARPAPLVARPRARVAIIGDCEVVTSGLRHLLEEHPDLEVVSELGGAPADLVLFDPALPGSDDRGDDLRALLRGTAPVVLFTWDAHRSVAERALADGVRGCLSKSLSGDVLAASLRRVLQGRVVVNWGDVAPIDEADAAAEAGLSKREVEVLSLIGRGLTNEDIAGRLFLSPNSIKSYIRSAYRKIGVERRSQAVLWTHQNHLGADAAALPLPAA